MKKLMLLVIAALVVAGLVFCVTLNARTKAPAEGTPTEVPELTPEPTATPEPTTEPVIIEIADPTPNPDTVSSELKDLVISDADVDAVMIEDVHAWQGFSVVSVGYEGQQTIFYVIPDDTSTDISTAIGEVVMSFNNDMVNSLNCRVYLDSMKKNEDKIRKLYDYFLNSFPVEVVGNLDPTVWVSIRDYIDMSFDAASAAAASGTETRDLCGQFVFHVASSLISFDFYVDQ